MDGFLMVSTFFIILEGFTTYSTVSLILWVTMKILISTILSHSHPIANYIPVIVTYSTKNHIISPFPTSALAGLQLSRTSFSSIAETATLSWTYVAGYSFGILDLVFIILFTQERYSILWQSLWHWIDWFALTENSLWLKYHIICAHVCSDY